MIALMKFSLCFRSTAATTGHEQWLMYYVDCKCGIIYYKTASYLSSCQYTPADM